MRYWKSLETLRHDVGNLIWSMSLNFPCFPYTWRWHVMIIAFACPCTQKVVTPFSKDRFHIREVKDKRVLMRVDFNVSRPQNNTMQRTMCLIFLDWTHFEQMRRIVFDGWHLSFQYLLVRPMDKEGNITNTQRIVWSLGKFSGQLKVEQERKRWYIFGGLASRCWVV